MKALITGGAKKAGAAPVPVAKKGKPAKGVAAVPVSVGKKASGGLKKVAPVLPVAAKGKKAGKQEAPAKKGISADVIAEAEQLEREIQKDIEKEAKKMKAAARAAERERILNELLCREVGCEVNATTAGYCRLHYIKNWKRIKRKELIIKEGKLNRYIEELVSKYPDKYIDAIREDLVSDASFAKVIQDLELETNFEDSEMDSDSLDSLIDGMRGSSGGATIEDDDDDY